LERLEIDGIVDFVAFSSFRWSGNKPYPEGYKLKASFFISKQIDGKGHAWCANIVTEIYPLAPTF
jgi:hypothetical protein